MNAEYAVLALVRMHPDVTGYQIKSIVDHTTGHLITLRLNRIYPALKSLTEKGMLTYREVPQPGRLPQKHYSLTNAGQEKLDEWFREPFTFSEGGDNFNEYLLKLGAMAYLDDEDILATIDHAIEFFRVQYAELSRAGRVEEDLSYVKSKNDGDKERFAKLWALEYQHMAAQAKARLDWLKKTRKHFEKARKRD